MAAYPMVYSFPLLILVLFFVPVPPLDGVFWWSALACLPVNAVSFLLYMLAIRSSPLSLTLPYLAFTPAFMVITGLMFLGEVPNWWGGAGILIICLGSYVLHLEPERQDIWAPFRAIAIERGSWIMLIVAFLFSIAAALGKKAILHSSALFFSIAFFAVFNLVLTLGMRFAGKIRWRQLTVSPAQGLCVGVLFFAHVLLHGLAIEMVKAAYMISIKRLSILIGVLYGAVLFKEAHIGRRLVGAAVMVCGSLLIILKGN